MRSTMSPSGRDARRLSLVTLCLAAALPAALPAQGPKLSVWPVAQVDPIGLAGNTRSPGMYGVQFLLLYHPTDAKWRYGVTLSASGASTRSGPDRFSSTSAGLGFEARRLLGSPGVRPYLVGTAAIANLRVDEPFDLGGGLTYFGGSDATSAILGTGVGVEVERGRFRLFADVQYHWRSNAIYGRSALPLRLGLRLARHAAP